LSPRDQVLLEQRQRLEAPGREGRSLQEDEEQLEITRADSAGRSREPMVPQWAYRNDGPTLWPYS
jgi:hypothetical protein